MTKLVRTVAYATVAGVIMIGLGGCFGGEPSEKEMAQAFHRNPKFQFSVGMLLSSDPKWKKNPEEGMAEMVKTGVVEKSACAQAQGAPGYVCDFRWGPKQPDGSVRYGAPMKGRFYKAGDGWNLEI